MSTGMSTESAQTPEETPSTKRQRRARDPRKRSGLTDKGLTLQGEFAPLIKTCELADWLNYASGGGAQWTSDRVRDYLHRAGALQRLSEDPEFAGSPRRPKPKTTRRAYFTTLNLLAQKLPDFHDALVRAADPDALERAVGN